MRQLFATMYARLLRVDNTDFTIYLFTNLVLANFDLMIDQERIPAKQEIQQSIQQIENFCLKQPIADPFKQISCWLTPCAIQDYISFPSFSTIIFRP